MCVGSKPSARLCAVETVAEAGQLILNQRIERIED
jgi:hypothetical protein